VLDACEFAIDAGRCPVSIPSTVVDLRPLAHGQPAAILREGPVSAEEISRKLETLDREP
jgi:tRNA A37 threonylcarbamoyladenosine synthetase subunit TsaC/SUA5/YrdC